MAPPLVTPYPAFVPFPLYERRQLARGHSQLTETELLKAMSYARVMATFFDCHQPDAMHILACEDEEIPALSQRVRKAVTSAEHKLSIPPPPGASNESLPTPHHGCNSQMVVDAALSVFLANVGATSRMVCEALLRTLHLSSEGNPKFAAAKERLSSATEGGVHDDWRVLYLLRKEQYYAHFASAANLRACAYSRNLRVVRSVVEAGDGHGPALPVAVATSSSTADATRVLGALGLADVVQAVVGADQVRAPKPAAEAYELAAAKLGVDVRGCVVLEDSLNGLRSGVAAGAKVVAVPTVFTEAAVRAQTVLPQEYCVYGVEEGPEGEAALRAVLRRRARECAAYLTEQAG